MCSCCGSWKYFKGKEDLSPKLQIAPQLQWLPPTTKTTQTQLERLWSQTTTWRYDPLQLGLTEWGEGTGLITCVILLLIFLKSLCFKERKRFLPCVTKYVAAFPVPDKWTHLHRFWKAQSCGALFTRCWVSLKLSKWFQGSVKQCVPRVQKESWFDTHNCHTKPTVNSHN